MQTSKFFQKKVAGSVDRDREKQMERHIASPVAVASPAPTVSPAPSKVDPNLGRFLSADNIAHCRQFALLPGFEVSNLFDGFSFENDETRLFEVPVNSGGWFAPDVSICGILIEKIVPGDGHNQPKNENVSIKSGRMCATDRRFIIMGKKEELFEIPFIAIKEVRHKDKVFIVQIDYPVIANKKAGGFMMPERPSGMSDDEYERRFIFPMLLDAFRGLPAQMAFSLRVPEAGFWDALIVLNANPVAGLIYAGLARQKTDRGADVIAGFFNLLNFIADQNRIG